MADVKKEAKTKSEHINLKVFGIDNTVVSFKVKKHAPLCKLINAYCDLKGLAIAAVRFLFDGERIYGHDTTATLKMEEGDTIDVFQEQISGS